jgi:hypothetical protein
MEESYYGIIQFGQKIQMILRHKLHTMPWCFSKFSYIVILYKNGLEKHPSILIYLVIE